MQSIYSPDHIIVILYVLYCIGMTKCNNYQFEGLESVLHQKGYFTMLLDGDNIRSGINRNLGFSEDDRLENIRRISEINKLFLNCGIVTISSFVSPTNDVRELAKSIIGEDDFLEIYVNAPLEVDSNISC